MPRFKKIQCHENVHNDVNPPSVIFVDLLKKVQLTCMRSPKDVWPKVAILGLRITIWLRVAIVVFLVESSYLN